MVGFTGVFAGLHLFCAGWILFLLADLFGFEFVVYCLHVVFACLNLSWICLLLFC